MTTAITAAARPRLSKLHHHHGSFVLSCSYTFQGLILVVLGWLITVRFAFLAVQSFHITETTTGAIQEDFDNLPTQRLSSSSSSLSIFKDSNQRHSSDFSLAYQQSYGFFDDIPDDDWKLYQTTARRAQHHAYPNDPLRFWNDSHNDAAATWYYHNYNPIFSCPHVQRVGGVGDGAKWTCDPHRLKQVAARRKRRIEEEGEEIEVHAKNVTNNDHLTAITAAAAPCLIYSVGCFNVYLWEDALVDLLGPETCEIHVFDPGNYSRPMINTARNIHYHPWGFASSYHDAPPRSNDGGLLFYTFSDILQRLGHTHRIIDIFKVDCEYCEWFQYRDWIDHGHNIRQLLLETHALPMPRHFESKWWPYPASSLLPTTFFDDLQAANFYLYSKEPNTYFGVEVRIYETRQKLNTAVVCGVVKSVDSVAKLLLLIVAKWQAYTIRFVRRLFSILGKLCGMVLYQTAPRLSARNLRVTLSSLPSPLALTRNDRSRSGMAVCCSSPPISLFLLFLWPSCPALTDSSRIASDKRYSVIVPYDSKTLYT